MCVDQRQLGVCLETAYSREVAFTVGDVVSMLWSHRHLFLDYHYAEKGFQGRGPVCHDILLYGLRESGPVLHSRRTCRSVEWVRSG